MIIVERAVGINALAGGEIVFARIGNAVVEVTAHIAAPNAASVPHAAKNMVCRVQTLVQIGAIVLADDCAAHLLSRIPDAMAELTRFTCQL